MRERKEILCVTFSVFFFKIWTVFQNTLGLLTKHPKGPGGGLSCFPCSWPVPVLAEPENQRCQACADYCWQDIQIRSLSLLFYSSAHPQELGSPVDRPLVCHTLGEKMWLLGRLP